MALTLIKLQVQQAERVLHACGWSMRTIKDPEGVDGKAYSCISPDGKAHTTYYLEPETALFFALTAHIGNGHWKPQT